MKRETTIDEISTLLFLGQPSQPVPVSPHAVYLKKMDPASRELLRLRDVSYEGNWDALVRVASSAQKPRIELLRAYEDSHHVDLGEYLRETA